MIAHAPKSSNADPADATDALRCPVQAAALPKLFWSVVPVSGVVRPGPIPIGVAADVQADIPVNLAELHVVCALSRAGEPRLLVCAARRTDLVSLLDGPATLSPAELPEFARDLGIAPAELNLLVGEFLPNSLRRRRTRCHLVAVATMLACVALVWVGLHRREAAATERARVADALRSAVLSTSDSAPRSADELRRQVSGLRQLRQALTSSPAAPDAGETLAAVLNAWPAALAPSPDSLSVQPSTISASISVDGDVRRVLDALSSARWPKDWVLQPPLINKAGDRTRLSVELHRTPSSSPSFH